MPQQKFLFSLNGHTNWVRTCQLSPDARLAVSGGDDHSVRVWDLETRATLHAFDELDGSVNVAAFHPDGAPAGWLAGCTSTSPSGSLARSLNAHTPAQTPRCFQPALPADHG